MKNKTFPCLGQHMYVLLFLILLLSQTGISQLQIVTPAVRSGFTSLTSYDSLRTFLYSLEQPPFMRIEEIARSRMGRSLFTVKISSSGQFGIDTTKTRVLLFAQQHGNEPSGKEALLMLLARIASRQFDQILSRLDLLIVPQMNPDGSELGKRTTSDSIDLNRNHVLLSSPETQGLHDLYFRTQPQVTMDVHEFGAASREWTHAGLMKTADVQLGMLTNLNTSPLMRSFQHEQVFPFIQTQMEKAGYKYQEYIVGSPKDRIRHSTTDINDGRQSLGILGSLSFIQEGRNGKSPADRLQQRALSQLKGIESLLQFCSEHSLEINALVTKEREHLLRKAGGQIVLRMEHSAGSGRVQIPVFNMKTNKDTVWTVAPYHDSVQALLVRKIPRAYYLPKEYISIIGVLNRHHVLMKSMAPRTVIEGEGWSIDSIGAEVLEEETTAHAYVTLKNVRITSNPGDILVPLEQGHSLFLSTFLEPESMWGVLKYKDFLDDIRRTGKYPLIRVSQ